MGHSHYSQRCNSECNAPIRMAARLELTIEAPNSLGVVCRVAAFLCDNLIPTKKIVIEQIENRIVPANIVRR